ncbi:RagB/SusD family nutrient uptake outer membrane protein [uncultured Muribaculum sp.]
MEASYELNHTIDGTADSYWRAIRTRANVDPNYNKTISLTDMNKEAENDWGAYSAGALLTDRTLYNIRRERRCELLSEGFRDADLKRWRSYDQLITSPAHLEGMHLWNTPMQDWYTDLVWNEANANVSAPEKSEYLRPFERTEGQAAYNGCTWRMAHYLNPLPINELMLTSPDGASPSESVLYQNPYWPLVAGKPAEK